MSRPTHCKKCGKFIGTEPGRKSTCLVCQDKLRKEKEVPWCSVTIESVWGYCHGL